MANKLGESVIQSAFADHLARRAIDRYGLNVPYVSANLQGKNDKQFADYFASIDSKCVLIEFKEFEKDILDEKRKPLRADLCELLTMPNYAKHESLASRGHFLAFGDIEQKIENIHSYPKVVCPIFSSDYEFSGASYTEKEFLSGLVKGSIGITIENMNRYVALLAKIAQQGKGQPDCPEFKAVLLSYDSNTEEGYKKQRFDDLCDLKNIMKAAMRQINKPSDLTP